MSMDAGRAGTYIRQRDGYRAFIPKPLPPDPPLIIDQELWTTLSIADRALGRLDGATEVLPNPNLFVAMYARREAVLSSQIEGTQASLADVLEYEADAARKGLPGDVAEVVNYVRAMNYGLERLESLPLSLRLMGEIHRELLAGVRGGLRSPGEFRRTQNWNGPPGCTLGQAAFVPPPAHEMMAALGDLEAFLHADVDLPALVKVGLVHAQFETIHPFIDGNGRVGRLLITFLLCQRKILRQPLLYLSLYLTRHKPEYYERLMAIRDYGDWEGWLKFFLRGVAEVANQATDTARRILQLREEHRHFVSQHIRGSANGLRLLDLLYERPIVSVGLAARQLAVTNPTANNLVNQLENAGLLVEITGRHRNRLFRYENYLSLFEDDLPHPGEEPAEAEHPVTASDWP
jgi:Fic family protein